MHNRLFNMRYTFSIFCISYFTTRVWSNYVYDIFISCRCWNIFILVFTVQKESQQKSKSNDKLMKTLKEIYNKFFPIKCKQCKTTEVSHGEKKWYGWVWWCRDCGNNRFNRIIESSPKLLAKYHEIHGDLPRNILK